jgi:hypothetical protein
MENMDSKEIDLYCKAFTNLYGIISVEKAWEIYQAQNGPVEKEAFVAALPPSMLRFSLIVHPDFTKNECKRLEKDQENKPYYIPDKAELLRYADPDYYEESEHSKAMVEFLCSHWNLTHTIARRIVVVFVNHIVCGEGVQGLDELCSSVGIQLRSREEMKEFVACFINLLNHTRMLSNKGFRPVDLHGGAHDGQ